MSHQLPENPLQLQDLVIAGFRGIRKLTIGRLGRVTLLAGRNGVGKTTVLEAVRVFASRGSHATLRDLLQVRDEFLAANGGSQRIPMPDFSALFYGRSPSGSRIVVGPTATDEQLLVEDVDLTEELGPLIEESFPEAAVNGRVVGLRAMFRGARQFLPVVGVPQELGGHIEFARAPGDAWRILRQSTDDVTDSARIKCNSVGPGLMGNHEIASYWEDVVLTPHETAVVEALKLVMGERVQRVAVIGSNGHPRRQARAIVRLHGVDDRVPLKSLGDGAVRLFGVALALANSQNGFLLIDEVENGIHHSLQVDFWRMVLRTARVNNVQVLATTHSFDCVRGFAEASSEFRDIGSALVRVARRDGEAWAIEYSEKDLTIAADQAIEVR
ncbi:MAG: AAA family ATPase [Rhodospirillaceae bacterium]|nr:AAA family ATPase [Rhodospirillaceae bacterium]